MVKIGIFDSGVGGLSVLREIRTLLPRASIIYVADQIHVPYGNRPLEEIRELSSGITNFLLDQSASLIVIACNTASAAALHHLRSVFPTIPFVGMEPAVKPAAIETRSGAVGVLATPATFQGMLYATLVDRFANGIHIFQNTCPGLVDEIEAGRQDGLEAENILRQAILPMLASKVDTLVLGCTHYPFVLPLIKKIAGESISIIDPAPAVARQVVRLYQNSHDEEINISSQEIEFYTTGETSAFSHRIQSLIKIKALVQHVAWDESGKKLNRR